MSKAFQNKLLIVGIVGTIAIAASLIFVGIQYHENTNAIKSANTLASNTSQRLPIEKSNHLNLLDPLEAGWKGELVCEVIEENERLRVLKCVFPPGVGHERHYHDPHVGYTLKGGRFQIKDSSGTREVDVPTGYNFNNDKVTVHEVLNIGETTAEFLIIEYK